MYGGRVEVIRGGSVGLCGIGLDLLFGVYW